MWISPYDEQQDAGMHGPRHRRDALLPRKKQSLIEVVVVCHRGELHCQWSEARPGVRNGQH